MQTRERTACGLLCGALVVHLVWWLAAPATALEVRSTQNTGKMMPYQVFELAFQHDGNYHDPTWDVAIDAAFTSPGNRRSRPHPSPSICPFCSPIAVRLTATATPIRTKRSVRPAPTRWTR